MPNYSEILAILNDRSSSLEEALKFLDQKTCVRFSVWCARRVVHLDPTGKSLDVIEAAEAWLLDPSERNCAAAKKASNAAWDAANAAWVTYAAAYAAAYAAYAAYAAADAVADAAARAARAAYWAAKTLPEHERQAEQEAQRYQLKLMVYDLLPEEEKSWLLEVTL